MVHNLKHIGKLGKLKTGFSVGFNRITLVYKVALLRTAIKCWIDFGFTTEG